MVFEKMYAAFVLALVLAIAMVTPALQSEQVSSHQSYKAIAAQ